MGRSDFFLLLALIFIFSTTRNSAHAQLSSENITQFIVMIGAISSMSESPYTIPKKVAQLDDSLFVSVADKKYATTIYMGYEYAVYTNKRGKHKAYQILVSNDNFTLFCQHFVPEECDCFEGLSIAGRYDEKPEIVRKLLPFSLKSNLVERINTYSDTKLDTDDFEKG